MYYLNRRRFLQISGAATAVANMPATAFAFAQAATQGPPTPRRSWMIYLDPRLGAEGETYRQRIMAAATTSPLLVALSAGQPPINTAFAVPTQPELAFNHVILIALPDDTLLMQAWQREAVIKIGVNGGGRELYAFGFGHIHGSIGYLESDRNPFLHAAAVAKAPFETQLISLTGTDRAGLGLAVDAFLTHGLVNGLVAAPGWKRSVPTLLDRDPLTPDFTLPTVLPATLGPLRRVAITQTGEDEYRGTLSDAGLLPRSIWQAKYYAPGQWDAAGQIASFHNYSVGLHRRAYGNSVWAATFASPAEAATAAPQIAAAAKLKASAGRWSGNLPPYAWGIADMGDGPSTGALELYVDGASLLLTAQSQPL